jgi:DNA-binding CsgD family transcriptional regulator
MVNKPLKKAVPFLSGQFELTEREIEVLQMICEGITAIQIGDKINLSSRTVEGHRNRIMEKTGTKNIAGLVAWAVRNGIV